MAGALTISTLKDSSGVLATQNGMTGIAKAWANFVGSSGTINGSFNVSSITRTGTGTYTVAFTTAMTNANYAVTTNSNSSGYVFGQQYNGTNTTTTLYLACTASTNGSAVDVVQGSFAVFSS